jgi:hypothetical protein
MAIKLTYKDLDYQIFNQAIVKISRHAFKNALVGYNAAKIWRKLKTELETAQDVYTKMLKQFANLDANGQFAPRKDETGADVPGTFTIKEGKEKEWAEAIKNYQTVSFELPCHQIRIDQLEDVGLTPLEMVALEAVIVDTAATETAAATATATATTTTNAA